MVKIINVIEYRVYNSLFSDVKYKDMQYYISLQHQIEFHANALKKKNCKY